MNRNEMSITPLPELCTDNVRDTGVQRTSTYG